MNWRAKPLVSYQVIIDLISATTTKTGLKVVCELDDNLYPKGVVVSDEELAAVNIVRADFHGEWNYTIKPSNRSDRAVDSRQSLKVTQPSVSVSVWPEAGVASGDLLTPTSAGRSKRS